MQTSFFVFSYVMDTFSLISGRRVSGQHGGRSLPCLLCRGLCVCIRHFFFMIFFMCHDYVLRLSMRQRAGGFWGDMEGGGLCHVSVAGFVYEYVTFHV